MAIGYNKDTGRIMGAEWKGDTNSENMKLYNKNI